MIQVNCKHFWATKIDNIHFLASLINYMWVLKNYQYLIFMHFEKSGPIARQWITLSLVLINTLSLLDPIFCNQSISNNCSYKPSFPPKLQRVCVMKVKAKSIWLVWPELFGLIQNIFTCIILIQIFTKSLIWKTHRTLKN